MRKRKLLRVIGSTGCLSITANSALASTKDPDESNNGEQSGSGNGSNGREREEYPQIPDEEVPDVPISDYATQIAFHPNHDRVAFSTAVFNDSFELYVAEGVDDQDSAAEAIWQITDSERMELAPEWFQNNRIQYNQGYVRYERRLPPSNKIHAPTIIEDPSLEGVNSL